MLRQEGGSAEDVFGSITFLDLATPCDEHILPAGGATGDLVRAARCINWVKIPPPGAIIAGGDILY